MLRLLGFILVLAAAFAGGFYTGVRHHEHQIIQEPNKFIQLYKNEFSATAKEKINALKKILRNKTDK